MKKDVNPFQCDKDEDPEDYQKGILDKLNEISSKNVKKSEQEARQSSFGANSGVPENILSKN